MDNPYDTGSLMSNRAKRAIVLMIGDRFFYLIGKKGQCLTSWSLAGARFFGGPGEPELFSIEEKLTAAGKKHLRVFVEVVRG